MAIEGKELSDFRAEAKRLMLLTQENTELLEAEAIAVAREYLEETTRPELRIRIEVKLLSMSPAVDDGMVVELEYVESTIAATVVEAVILSEMLLDMSAAHRTQFYWELDAHADRMRARIQDKVSGKEVT